MMLRLTMASVISLAVCATCGCERECEGPTAPCNGSADLSGLWSGSSTYMNAPFTMDLRQTGTTVTGRYQDQHDQGSVNGTVSGSSFVLDVNFGDTGIKLPGRASRSIASPERSWCQSLEGGNSRSRWFARRQSVVVAFTAVSTSARGMPENPGWSRFPPCALRAHQSIRGESRSALQALCRRSARWTNRVTR